jgi:excisionase family DNA binding protein
VRAATVGGGAKPPSDRFLSVKEAAEVIGVDVRTVYILCRTQGLKHARLSDTPNGVIRFRREWIDEWLEQRAQINGGKR